jgi:hypothetical protein
LNPAWELEQAVDMLALLASLESYQQLVVERGWTTEALVRRVVDLSGGNILVEPGPRDEAKRRRK